MAGETVSVPVNLEKFRYLVKSYIEKHQFRSAIFWADKVVSLSDANAEDVYWLAQCLYMSGQYHRAAHCIESRLLYQSNIECRFLAAKCHYEAKEFQEALDLLEWEDSKTKHKTPWKNDGSTADKTSDSCGLPEESNLSLLKGKIYEAMDNRTLAVQCYTNALRQDVFCYEAFDLLVQHHMMFVSEEQELLDSLPFSKQCPEEMELVQFFYGSKLKKYSKPSSLKAPDNLPQLNENLDVVVSLAERHYYNCEFRECYQITSQVLTKDPFHSDCLPVHISCLVELKKSNELFYLAHKLVDFYPDKPVAWFAVGCYYLLVKKNDAARQYLSKATTLDRVYGPAWLAYGHSFAVENEHDQAMAAYFKASTLMKGCHLPLLYIGLEYGLTNNSKLADRFFSQALAIAPNDPFVLHEMGVIAYQNNDYESAEKHFSDALESIKAAQQSVSVEKWEPLLNNLGHACRKLKKYDMALEFHRRALVLSPQNPSTYSAMGYVHSLLGNMSSAVDYFHKALGLRRDDTFSTTMLEKCMQNLISELDSSDDGPEEFPIPKDGPHFKSVVSDSAQESELTMTHPSLPSDSMTMDASDMIVDTSMELEGSDDY